MLCYRVYEYSGYRGVTIHNYTFYTTAQYFLHSGTKVLNYYLFLADATHQFANENWKQIMDDLAPPAVKQIVRTTIRNINKFFAKVTVPQIMIGYDELRRSNSTN